jgi:hypothetical protein
MGYWDDSEGLAHELPLTFCGFNYKIWKQYIFNQKELDRNTVKLG